jgi:hypothetical protein
VQVRNPDPSFDPDSDPGSDVVDRAAATGRVSFTVPRAVMWIKFAIAGFVALGALVVGNQSQYLVLLLVAAGMAAYAGRDLVARERLRADEDGLVAVRGYSSRRVLAWSEIERIRVYATSRFGTRSEMLEVDTGDEIFQFSRYDLGVDPDEAVKALEVIRPH